MNKILRRKNSGLSRETRIFRPQRIRQGAFELPDADDTLLSGTRAEKKSLQNEYGDSLKMEPHCKKVQHKNELPQKDTASSIKNAEKANVSSKSGMDKATPLPPEEGFKWTLYNMAIAVLSRVTIIKHDGFLYYYTGRTYRIIKNADDLLFLIRSEVSVSAFNCTSTRRFSSLYTFMQADKEIIPYCSENKSSQFQSQYYISFQNGVLDLLNMKLLPHSSKYLTFYELNMQWREYAHSGEFEKFLKKVSGNDKEITLRIMEVIGYLLSSVNEGKCFFVMGTAPNSGKSTVGRLLEALLGRDLIMSRAPHQMGRQFPFGDLPGKLLNLALDLPNGKFNSITVSIIKQITGGDTITVEQKYEKMRDVHSNMRFLFGSNFPITVSQEDDDEAFWNRMVVIPFLHSLNKEEEDPLILQKLLNENEGIVCQCLKAFHKVLKNNCIFSYCGTAEKMKKSWRYYGQDSTGSILQFADKFIESTGNPKDWIYTQDLYQQYRAFCENISVIPISYSAFRSWMLYNVDGCQKTRAHPTNHNPRSALAGIKFIGLLDDNMDKAEGR